MLLRQTQPLAKKIKFANNFAAVQTVDELKALVDTLYESDSIIGFDIETGYHGADYSERSLDMYNENQFIAGFSITNSTSWARYVPVKHDFANNIDPNVAWSLVKPLLEDKVGVAHNILFEATNLRQLDVKGDGPRIEIPISKWHDSMIQGYVLSDVTPMRVNGDIYGGDYVYRYVPDHLRLEDGYQDPKKVSFTTGLKSLTKFRYNYSQAEIFTLFNGGKELTSKQKKMIRFNPLPIDPTVVHYACDDAYLCLRLHHDQYEAISNDPYLPNVYNLEMQIAEVLADMNEVGVAVDWAGIVKNKETFESFSHGLKMLAKSKFEEETGVDQSALNFNSPAQMAKIIYGTREEGGLGMEVTSTTNTGSPSTNDKALTSIRKMSPAVDTLLKYRQCNKMGEWFNLWDSLKDQSLDGRIHPNFIQTRIQSGRFASAGPNCVQGDVEVLTPNGWVRFDQLKDGVQVAQVSTDGVVSFVVPENVIRKQFKGSGVRMRSSEDDIWTTPDHRMLTYSTDGAPIFEPASAWLTEQGARSVAGRNIRRAGGVLGGTMLTEEERMGLEQAIAAHAGESHINNDEGNRWISENLSLRTSEILGLDKNGLKFFMQCASHRNVDNDLVQAAAALIGGDPINDLQIISDPVVSEEEYEGMVYCVTVPTSAFLIRSNGTVMATGNCQNLTKRWWFQTSSGSVPEVMSSGEFGVDYWTGNARDFLVASPGYKILSFDYKSAEIQFLAALAQETEIIEAFRNGEDFHKWTASLVFAKHISEVTKKERQAAKTISFASVYGSGIPNMAQQLGISIPEMQDIYDKYFARFPKLAKYFEDQHALVKETNEVRTWLGRRAVIWESMHPDRGVTNKAERMSVNIPVQGGATGDYTKMAMVRVSNKLKQEGLWMDKVRLLMNQHDSLVFEVHDSLDMDEVIELLTPQVQFDLTGIQGCYNEFDSFPPMSVDWEVGVTWGSVCDADKSKYLFSKELVITILPGCPVSVLNAVTGVLSTNPGDVPVTLRTEGKDIPTKFRVKSHPDVVGKVMFGDPDLGIEAHDNEFVSAEFRLLD